MAYTSFMRGDNTKMTNTPYTDGLIFLNTEEQALYLDDNNKRIPMGGAGTGGHIIENNAGTDMTERTNLQFGGVYVSDDETNDRTKVNVTRNMTKDAFDQLTTAEKLGVIVTSNDPNDYVPFSADMVEYDNTNSGMTATDVQDAIDELSADLGDKISASSVSGNDAFSKIATLYTALLNVGGSIRYSGNWIQISTDGGSTWNNLCYFENTGINCVNGHLDGLMRFQFRHPANSNEWDIDWVVSDSPQTYFSMSINTGTNLIYFSLVVNGVQTWNKQVNLI